MENLIKWSPKSDHFTIFHFSSQRRRNLKINDISLSHQKKRTRKFYDHKTFNEQILMNNNSNSENLKLQFFNAYINFRSLSRIFSQWKRKWKQWRKLNTRRTRTKIRKASCMCVEKLEMKNLCFVHSILFNFAPSLGKFFFFLKRKISIRKTRE